MPDPILSPGVAEPQCQETNLIIYGLLLSSKLFSWHIIGIVSGYLCACVCVLFRLTFSPFTVAQSSTSPEDNSSP